MSDNGKDVNISALLNSFQMGYDKRVRPNYGGKSLQKPIENQWTNSINSNFSIDNYIILGVNDWGKLRASIDFLIASNCLWKVFFRKCFL